MPLKIDGKQTLPRGCYANQNVAALFEDMSMKFTSFRSLGTIAVLWGFLLVPAFAQPPSGTVSAQSQAVDVPLFSVIESIEFNDVRPGLQKVALERLGVRVGDILTGEARQRIGRELGHVQKGMTFTYKPGSKFGTAKLIISGDC
ncbi:MAG: hypothetical protein KIT09_30365 [Bryobacteraceae bacterium]|nr:hypothetical protein [Bryobacteraceae bacterium]